MKARAVVRDTAIVLAIAAGMLGGLEIVLRLAFPTRGIYAPKGPPKAAAYAFDPDTLVALKPDLRRTVALSDTPGDTVAWETNSRGFRGGELRPAHGARILVYGDSNVQSVASPLAETFPARIEAHLAAACPRCDVEVVNAGVTGFGPDQSLARMTKDLDRYHPRAVVLVVFADNDYGDIVRNRLFDVDASGRLVPTPFERKLDPQLEAAAEPETLLGRIWASSQIVAAGRLISERLEAAHARKEDPKTRARHLIEAVKDACAQEYAVYRDGKPQAFSEFDDHYDLDLATVPTSDAARAKVRLMEAVLAETDRATREKGVTLLVVVLPSVVDLTDLFLFGRDELRSFPGYDPRNLSRPVEDICARRGIPALGLYDVFEKAGADRLYRGGDDNHWNAAGQDVAAEAVAARLLDMGAVPGEGALRRDAPPPR